MNIESIATDIQYMLEDYDDLALDVSDPPEQVAPGVFVIRIGADGEKATVTIAKDVGM